MASYLVAQEVSRFLECCKLYLPQIVWGKTLVPPRSGGRAVLSAAAGEQRRALLPLLQT